MQTKGLVHGLPQFTLEHSNYVCEVCQLGKHSHPFLSKWNVSKCMLYIIHLDIWGLPQNETVGGYRYFVTFINDYLWLT